MKLILEPTRRLAAFALLSVVITPALRSAGTTAAPPARAGADEVIALDQITVSAATRTEKLASALPMTTTVVTAEQLVSPHAEEAVQCSTAPSRSAAVGAAQPP